MQSFPSSKNESVAQASVKRCQGRLALEIILGIRNEKLIGILLLTCRIGMKG